MRHRVESALASLAAAAAIGCGSAANPLLCTSIPDPALEITVIDSITQGGPNAASTLTIEDGTYREVRSDSADLNGRPFRFDVGNGRPGTYSVLIETPGYQDWRRADVHVSAGQCVPNAVSISALLQPD